MDCAQCSPDSAATDLVWKTVDVESNSTSPARGLDYSWSYFTEPSPWFLCRNGPEFLALDPALRTNREAE